MADVSLERARKSVELFNFVEFYEDYWAHYQKDAHLRKVDKKRLAQKLLDSNPKATSPGAQSTRISYTMEIFKNSWEVEMLKATIESDHFSITSEIRNKAKLLLDGSSRVK